MFCRVLNDCDYIGFKNKKKKFTKIKNNVIKMGEFKNSKISLKMKELNLKRIPKDNEIGKSFFYLLESNGKYISIQPLSDIYMPVKNENRTIEIKNIRDLKIGDKILMLSNNNMNSTIETTLTNFFTFPIEKFKFDTTNILSNYILSSSGIILNDFIMF